ncbi:MAG: aegerolysin family protein [Clostridiales bacterium]|nr:aegerolysin family protein [Clostridiales bacterium]
MAYAQWATFDINVKGFSVIIQNASLAWGKFYVLDHKDQEISVDDMNKRVIEYGSADEDRIICVCGRSDAASGTQGKFEIYRYDPSTQEATVKLAVVTWDCPWGNKHNSFDASCVNQNYMVSHSNANLDSGALGSITITIREFDE